MVGFRTLVIQNCLTHTHRLLLVHAPESASAFIQDYVQNAIKLHPALLLPVKPNPREYRSPAKVSTYSSEIFMTASPSLNFSQNAVALICDVKSKSGSVPNEMKSAWQMLLRQFVQEGGLAGMDSIVDVCVLSLFNSNINSFCHKFRAFTLD